MDLNDPRIASAVQFSADWRAAVGDLLSLFAQERRCYSSGEVAAALRLHRPNLVFSVPALGRYIREELFYKQALPLYTEPDGTTLAPVQVPRFTVGKFPTRTPANVEVFVYGPDASACNGHEFEVFVPKPGETAADAPAPATTQTNASTGPGTPTHDAAVAIYGAQPGVQEIRATVWPDGRCCVPRTAFEAACHLGSTVIRVGEPVFVTVEPGVKAVINLVDPGNGAARSYTPWKEQGRVAFINPDAASPFVPGTNFRVEVAAGEITVDLANPL